MPLSILPSTQKATLKLVVGLKVQLRHLTDMLCSRSLTSGEVPKISRQGASLFLNNTNSLPDQHTDLVVSPIPMLATHSSISLYLAELVLGCFIFTRARNSVPRGNLVSNRRPREPPSCEGEKARGIGRNDLPTALEAICLDIVVRNIW